MRKRFAAITLGVALLWLITADDTSRMGDHTILAALSVTAYTHTHVFNPPQLLLIKLNPQNLPMGSLRLLGPL